MGGVKSPSLLHETKFLFKDSKMDNTITNGVTDADRESFLKTLSENGMPGIPEGGSVVTDKGKSQDAMAMYKEAIGSDTVVTLMDGTKVMVGRPKVRGVKKFIAISDSIKNAPVSQQTAEIIEVFQDIMVDCLSFPCGNKPEGDLNEWYNDLDAEDGFTILDAFRTVFDIQYLISRSTAIAKKK